MILIDTNVFSELMSKNGNLAVLEWLSQQPRSDLFISSIILAEIFAGIEVKDEGKRKDQLRESAKDVSEFFEATLVFDEYCAVTYGKLMGLRSRLGRPIEKFDCMIASIALVNDLDLATRNVKDFEGIPNLNIINPWEGV